MHFTRAAGIWWTGGLLLCVFAAQAAFAGVSRAIQDKYRRSYENKALFLKVPVLSDKQYVFLRGRGINPDQGPNVGAARFKVGDQVRILALEFGGDEIRFKLSALSGTGAAELVFKFDSGLLDAFPNSDVFDKALQSTFTEGLKYSDIEEAKRGYVEDQFERVVREVAAASGTPRETVLKNIAPRLPAFQDALRDVENLKSRSQDLSGQVAQAQIDNRKLDAELKNQQAEAARLRGINQTLQEKIDNSTSQLSRLGEDLRSAKGVTQGYQSALASLQRSLNLKVDANRDLAAQINELGQVLRRIQKDNENLEAQNGALRGNADRIQAENSKLTGELEDARANIRQMKEMLNTLTSKEDSLARQYLDLKRKKENLDNFVISIDNLSARTIEEKAEGGYGAGKAGIYLREILIGTLAWRLPDRLNHGEERPGEISFSTESIDYVKVTPDERHILRSLGDRLKVQAKLTSLTPTMEVRPDKDIITQEIGERDRAVWNWKIFNGGTQDARVAMAVHLINKNTDDIPVFQREQAIASSSVVRQVRNYLQPLPIAVGALLGFLLFGIAGIFRRGRRAGPASRKQRAIAPDTATNLQKKL